MGYTVIIVFFLTLCLCITLSHPDVAGTPWAGYETVKDSEVCK